MPLFPDIRHAGCSDYADRYFEHVARAAASVDRAALHVAAELLIDAVTEGRMVFSCGNGGSAAIANHLVCDHMKGVRAHTDLKPRIVSFSSTVELITALANDVGVEEMFAYQLRAMASRGDVLIAISSSGSSPNIVKTMRDARDLDIRTIAMTGFDGGEARALAAVSLHVDHHNYGVVEDVHQSLMHILAQYIRHAHVEPARLGSLRF